MFLIHAALGGFISESHSLSAMVLKDMFATQGLRLCLVQSDSRLCRSRPTPAPWTPTPHRQIPAGYKHNKPVVSGAVVFVRKAYTHDCQLDLELCSYVLLETPQQVLPKRMSNHKKSKGACLALCISIGQ